MKTSVSTKVTSMVTSAKSKIQSLKTSAATAWAGMKTNAASTFESIKSAITTKLQSAKDKVTSIVQAIKNKFPFKLGKIISFRVPSISLNTSTRKVLGKTITYPSGFSVSWHRRNYDVPMEYKRKTVVASPGRLDGYGDGAGSEIVYGKRKLLRDVAYVAKELGNRQVTVNVYARDDQSAREIAMQVRNILVNDEQNHRMAWA